MPTDKYTYIRLLSAAAAFLLPAVLPAQIIGTTNTLDNVRYDTRMWSLADPFAFTVTSNLQSLAVLSQAADAAFSNRVQLLEQAVPAAAAASSNYTASAASALSNRVTWAMGQATNYVDASNPYTPASAFTWSTNAAGATVTGFTGSQTRVRIPPQYLGLPVVKIGDNAFEGKSQITSFTLPETLRDVGASAFKQCANSLSLTLPAAVTNIGLFAFYYVQNPSVFVCGPPPAAADFGTGGSGHVYALAGYGYGSTLGGIPVSEYGPALYPQSNPSNYVAASRVQLLENRSNVWNTAYSWGDWSSRVTGVEIGTNSWNTAYGWGDWSFRMLALEGRTNTWNTLPSYVVTNSGTAALSSLSVSRTTKLGTMAADSMGANAYGGLQAGYNDSLMGSWLVDTLGAWQIGYTAEYSGISATNLGVAAVQIFSLDNAGEKALTTTGGRGSLMLGAGVSSNRHALVVGNGSVSHGDGSVTASGGFWGSGIGLTDIRDTLALTNLSSPTLTGLALQRYTNALANAYTVSQVSGAPASVLGRYNYKATSVYTNGLGWQIYAETSPLFTVYISSLPPLASGTYTFMSGAVPRNSSSGTGLATGTIQLDYAYSPAAYPTTILSTNGIEGAALRPASVPSTALSTAPLYPTGNGSQLTGITAAQVDAAPYSVTNAINLTSNDLSTVYYKMLNALVMPSGEITVPSITGITGTTVTVTFPASHYYYGNETYYALPALSATSYANTQIACIDISNPSSLTWTKASPAANIKATKTKLVIFANWYGRLYSPIPSVQKLLDAALVTYNTATYPVYTNVTVGATGCQYTNITSALAAISTVGDNSDKKRYTILVSPGVYQEPGPSGNGLTLLAYVDIVGAGRDLVTIKGPEKAAGQEHTGSTIQIPAHCTISGMTILAYKCKYPVHCDYSGVVGLLGYDRTFTVRDCNLRHYGGADGYYYDVGVGMYQNQHLNLINCNMSGRGVYVHGPANTRADKATSWELSIVGSSLKELTIQDFMDYNRNLVSIKGSDIKTVSYAALTNYFSAAPTDPNFNRGWLAQAVSLQSEGSKIGRVDYSTGTYATNIVAPFILPGLNVLACSTNAAIPKGYAVKLLSDFPIQNAYPSPVMPYNDVSVWDGAGIFFGVAEVNIATNAPGNVQVSGTPYVFADATGTAIAYGDALELTATGTWVKRASGDVRGYALGALPSGTGLIVARLLQ